MWNHLQFRNLLFKKSILLWTLRSSTAFALQSLPYSLTSSAIWWVSFRGGGFFLGLVTFLVRVGFRLVIFAFVGWTVVVVVVVVVGFRFLNHPLNEATWSRSSPAKLLTAAESEHGCCWHSRLFFRWSVASSMAINFDSRFSSRVESRDNAADNSASLNALKFWPVSRSSWS